LVKLATLQGGGIDGKLLVVSKDLSRAVVAVSVAATLQQALETWEACEPKLRALYDSLNEGHAAGSFALDVAQLVAPLPRAWQWLDASAFHSHGDLMEQVFGLSPPPEKHTRPLMYQGAQRRFPRRRRRCAAAIGGGRHGLRGRGRDHRRSRADGHPRRRRPARTSGCWCCSTTGACACWRARTSRPDSDFMQSKPATSFAPVAVTPDELGSDWRDGRVRLPIRVYWNGNEFGHPDCSAMGFSFEQLVEHAARTRNLAAGTVIGSGTISNPDYRTVGSACIAERRGIELVDQGKPSTPYMKFGDRVRMELLDAAGKSIFGAIDQRVVQAKAP
jgi:fumarylacetoacetate (FAA) hydrolase